MDHSGHVMHGTEMHANHAPGYDVVTETTTVHDHSANDHGAHDHGAHGIGGGIGHGGHAGHEDVREIKFYMYKHGNLEAIFVLPCL